LLEREPDWKEAEVSLFVSTTTDEASGESIEMKQLAQAIGAELIYDVPAEGSLIYFLNINIRAAGAKDFEALARRALVRRAPTIIIAGVCKGLGDAEKWRRYWTMISRVADLVFVHHRDQVPYLQQYGVDAVLKPINEERYRGPARPQPGTVLYSGFFWDEKDLTTFARVASLLPERRFVLQVGAPPLNVQGLPPNCELRSEFIPAERYLEFLASHELIWLPRFESRQIYAGRSGISAIASGRPALLTDVNTNAMIPPEVAIKYPADWQPHQIAALIARCPTPERAAVDRYLDSVSPQAVWATMRTEIERRGLTLN